MNKIKSRRALETLVKKFRVQGKRIIFTNGCFDIIHPGHIKVLRQAKQKGDILIVGLNSDCSIRRIKGENRPVNNQTYRAQVLAAIGTVDYVVLFNEDTPYELIKTIRPDCLVKGGDWGKENIVGSDIVKKVYRVKLRRGYSTTNIIKKIIKNTKP
jgi:D-beta-D-heptose 7-phosphate kinase/D-beta-D-heptose 1-phosphate adenosyltransferase